MAEIVLINPRFEVSYWGMEYALPLFGKRAVVPPACLPLLAALTPAGHRVTLIDENVEPIDFDRCARADIVGVTGMIVQRFRMREILAELKRRGAFTVAGGPWVTVSTDYFGDLADVVFVGEAEETWPQFLAEWRSGGCRSRYQQAGRTDMATVPTPRFDLLRMRRYAFGSVQFTRGCPFQCEFCDIIVVFGRRPRIKTCGQVIAELEALRARGMTIVFIVDDNLIGNRKAIREVLEAVVAWQESRGYPMTFVTETSIDLADDPDLMALMAKANIRAVFVGIESPNEASLRETRKLQNLRRGSTMLEKVHRIQEAGIEVWSGMILGFDHDDETIFEAQERFLTDGRIVSSMIGMLYAIPSTPLHARLAAEGRLDPADAPEHGTNIVPARIGREALRDGYVRLLTRIYDPSRYFDRLDDLLIRHRLAPGHGETDHWRRHPWRGRRAAVLASAQALGLYLRLMRGVPDPALRREYHRRLWHFLKARPEPKMVLLYAIKCAMHYHAHRMAHGMASGEAQVVNSY